MSVTRRSPGVQTHWVIPLIWRHRSLSFLALFITLASHIGLQGHSPWLFIPLAISFLGWPPLAYVRAQRASRPVYSELNNLIVDSVIFGWWISTLGFSLWITFILGVGTAMNLVVFRGVIGLLQAFAGLGAGILLGGVTGGFYLQPDIHWLTTTFAVAFISIYLLRIGHLSFHRNASLRRTRERQRITEMELKRQIGENHALQEKLVEQANRDPLTGLYNRRYLEDSLSREMSRCLREKEPLSLVMIDLDHFKAVNDIHGHAAGDRILIKMANVLLSLCRASDIVCRIGGEEFLVVLPGTDLDAATTRAEEYRRTLESAPLEPGESNIPVTLSAGVACSYGETEPQDLIRQADQALYEAKETGRNRVIGQGSPVSTP